jgi:pimeloyl-ACP methyl ester carboxylesterase
MAAWARSIAARAPATKHRTEPIQAFTLTFKQLRRKWMATFVQVHGGWHGSWCWKRVRKALQARRHDVFTPTLTGVGERSHLLSPDVNLDTHITDVVNLIRWEELSGIVLCGHSYGGCVITGVADRLSDRIAALVYLDAFVPEDGQSLYDILPTFYKTSELEAAQRDGEGWKVPPKPAEVLNVSAGDREWVNRQCTMQPIATFQQVIKLSGKGDPVKRVTFILATDFPNSPFPAFYERAKVRGWKTLTIPCGHDVMLDRPEELTGALLEIAGRGSQRLDQGLTNPK